MKALIGKLMSLLIVRTPDFRGKVRLLRLFAPICSGVYIKGKYGVRMRADLCDDTHLFAILGWYDSVANEVSNLLPGEAFVDIGANAGVFSLMAGKRVGPTGVVVSFEPQRRLFGKLVDNVDANDLTNVICFNMAISDRTHTSAMQCVSSTHTGLAALYDGDHEIGDQILVVCPSTDLRVLERLLDRRATTIKIDVEGHELQVLKGIGFLLHKDYVRKVIVELDPVNLKRFGTRVEDVYWLMNEYGFEPRRKIENSAHYDQVFVK